MPPPRFYVSCALNAWLRHERFMRKAGPFPIELVVRGKDLDAISGRPLRRFRRYLADTGLPLLLHGPFEDLRPGSRDRTVQEAALSRYVQTVRLALSLGAGHVVFHTGFRPHKSPHGQTRYFRQAGQTFRRLIRSIPDLPPRFLLLENTQESDPAPLVALAEDLGPSAGFCLDSGHGHVASKLGSGAWVEAFRERLVEIHLHDNHGHMDEHLACPEGTIDWADLFSRPRPAHCDCLTCEHLLPEQVERTRAWLASTPWMRCQADRRAFHGTETYSEGKAKSEST